MQKTFEQIKREIESDFIGSRYEGITATEEQLTEIFGVSVDFEDSKIDDGVTDDDAEDCYVMCDVFSTKDGKFDILIYYGDVTEEIGCVQFRKN
jgi:hypothetical protein